MQRIGQCQVHGVDVSQFLSQCIIKSAITQTHYHFAQAKQAQFSSLVDREQMVDWQALMLES